MGTELAVASSCLAVGATAKDAIAAWVTLDSAATAAQAQGKYDELAERFFDAEVALVRDCVRLNLNIPANRKLGRLVSWFEDCEINLLRVKARCLEEGLSLYGFYLAYVAETKNRGGQQDALAMAISRERSYIPSAVDGIMDTLKSTGRVNIIKELEGVPETYRGAVDQLARQKMRRAHAVCTEGYTYVNDWLLTDEERQEAMDRKFCHVYDTLAQFAELANGFPIEDARRGKAIMESCHTVRDAKTLKRPFDSIVSLLGALQYGLKRAANCEQYRKQPTTWRYRDVLTDDENAKLNQLLGHQPA